MQNAQNDLRFEGIRAVPVSIVRTSLNCRTLQWSQTYGDPVRGSTAILLDPSHRQVCLAVRFTTFNDTHQGCHTLGMTAAVQILACSAVLLLGYAITRVGETKARKMRLSFLHLLPLGALSVCFKGTESQGRERKGHSATNTGSAGAPLLRMHYVALSRPLAVHTKIVLCNAVHSGAFAGFAHCASTP